jgi:hypothetical protein
LDASSWVGIVHNLLALANEEMQSGLATDSGDLQEGIAESINLSTMQTDEEILSKVINYTEL